MYNFEDEGFRKFNIPFLVAGILLVILGVGFFYYYSQVSSTISVANSTISNLNKSVSATAAELNSAATQASSLGDQLSAANTQISALKNQVSSGNAQVSSLQGQLSSANSQLASLQTQMSTYNSQIATLQSQHTSDTSQLSNLQSQTSSYQSQINSYQTQITSLQNQVYALQSQISTPGSQTTLFSSQAVSQAANVQTVIYSFTPAFSGNIVISGASNSSTGYISVTNTTSGVSNPYTFGTGTAISIPLTAGNNYSIYFGNHDGAGTITATLTGTYSNSSSTSGQTTLFSSQAVSQAANVQTVVYAFTPTYSGYLGIHGTSSSSTGYISVTNITSGVSNPYTLGTGTAISIPLTAGNNYSIYFGNHEASGTITATLTGTYSSTSPQTTLFSSQAVSQVAYAQTVVYSFTPTNSGYIAISGTSSSTTGYILVTNTTTGVSNPYTFGTGTTLSIPLTASNYYSIYFGNHDSSGTITASLTGIYQ